MDSVLRQEIKQTKPFRSLRQEVVLNLMRTASTVRAEVDELLAAHGLSQPQYNVLRILRGAGPDGLGRNDIRDRMITRMPDVTRLLDRMEAAGLVTRVRSTGDRRVVTTTLTPHGTELVAQLDAPTLQLHERVLGHLSDEQLHTLLDLLVLVRTTDTATRTHTSRS